MKAQAILCIVKPDKIFLAWKPDLPNQGRLDHQAAEGADIVDERFFFVCRLRHGPVGHEKRAGNPAPVAGINASIRLYRAGIGQKIIF